MRVYYVANINLLIKLVRLNELFHVSNPEFVVVTDVKIVIKSLNCINKRSLKFGNIKQKKCASLWGGSPGLRVCFLILYHVMAQQMWMKFSFEDSSYLN